MAAITGLLAPLESVPDSAEYWELDSDAVFKIKRIMVNKLRVIAMATKHLERRTGRGIAKAAQNTLREVEELFGTKAACLAALTIFEAAYRTAIDTDMAEAVEFQLNAAGGMLRIKLGSCGAVITVLDENDKTLQAVSLSSEETDNFMKKIVQYTLADKCEKGFALTTASGRTLGVHKKGCDGQRSVNIVVTAAHNIELATIERRFRESELKVLHYYYRHFCRNN